MTRTSTSARSACLTSSGQLWANSGGPTEYYMNHGNMARLGIILKSCAHAKIWLQVDLLADIGLEISLMQLIFLIFSAGQISKCLRLRPYISRKLSLSHFQPFGIECLVYVRPGQRNDREFDAQGVP